MDERNGAEDAIGRRDERGAIDELLCFALLCFARRSTELTDAASGCDSTTLYDFQKKIAWTVRFQIASARRPNAMTSRAPQPMPPRPRARASLAPESPMSSPRRKTRAIAGLNADLLDQLSFYGSYHRNAINQCIHFVFVPGIVWSALVWMASSGPLLPASALNLPAAISSTPWMGAALPDALVAAASPNLAFFAMLAYASHTLVPIRPRRRGERRSLRTLPGASLRPPIAFNPRPRRLSTPTDAFELRPDVALYGTTLRYAFYYVLLEPFAGVAWTLLVGVPSFLTATWYRAARGDAACANALVVHLLSWYMQIHPGHAVFEKRRPALTESLFQSLALAPLFVWLEALFALGYRPKLRARLKRRVARRVERMDAIKARGLAERPSWNRTVSKTVKPEIQ
ncbi:uncharacterized protein MICPUCDRAFT_58351 [Micromonas pusilla CCMP1545]|uniref:Predicted protein n=1 Tax=Micromonas pusilla (strain CCMP1545) TaxID=564608 RepID=C1MS53_MICPC|nr:uncharacterized protein MICPUCDRAFT_58351 [Micromonas pusilla CCMP1545]EEH57441.1 predicted protein [Micromonas pusilla CCMP1545]|eukprot:XP_003058986.1 predicted protein [Micromonas pusilla CCMP1545]